MSDIQLAEFQQAAVKVICDRLLDRSGPRRFLLADEVGLGKTIVARGVLDEWQRRRPGRDFTVVYLCSNTEIAEQNRIKLASESGPSIRRVTQLAYGHRRASGFRLYSFTPGTSLSDGTGLKWERQLLLFLVFRVLRQDIREGKWREYFRCSARAEAPGDWFPSTQLRALRHEFDGKVRRPVQHQIAEVWNRPVDFEGTTIRPAECLAAEVQAFEAEKHSSRRNKMIGLLRQAVQRVLLDDLKPDLVVLDEVQKFRHVIEDVTSEKSIAARLFERGAAVLILSATPYRMLSLDHEVAARKSATGESAGHYDEFLATIKFLYDRQGSGVVRSLQQDLLAFRTRLEEGHFARGDDERLRTLRSAIERRLRRVMARTERNWYLDERGQGVEEVLPPEHDFGRPQREELADYVRLRRFLLDKVETSQHVTEYWKSCPAPFTFMDAQYAPMAATRRQRGVLPPGVVARPQELRSLSRRNLRLRSLFRALFGDDAQAWRYLWARPNYTYYRDEFFGDAEPRKALVFSGWRFVPKAIALLASHEAEQRIAPGARLWSGEDHQPLRFTDRGSFHVFDVCFPSPALAALVEPSQYIVRGWTSRRLLLEVRKRLKDAFAASGVTVAETSSASAWEAIARLDAGAGHVGDALTSSGAYADREVAGHFRRHARDYIEWMDAAGTLRISSDRLDHIARIAAFSPAISLLRAAWSVYPDSKGSIPDGWMDLCIEAVRSYFNRRVVRAVVDHNTRRTLGYAQSVLQYCEQAHFQAVADEYVYLLRHVLQRDEIGDVAEHLSRVLGIGVGTPTINLASNTGRLREDSLPRRAHFALAFGEDVKAEHGESLDQSLRTRKTAVREAFNSPFWPFVLATTSVGQEGLDFHLYCRDIVHWNLPSNPVDLEQREGRINRRDGLAIRRAIARAWPPARIDNVVPPDGANVWRRAFAAIEGHAASDRSRHGLYPHWVFDDERGEPSRIRRHLFFYDESHDTSRYRLLKERLALYRLVFGQPRQQDLLERVQRRLASEADLLAQHAALTRYMINLSPVGGREAVERSYREADRISGDVRRLRDLLRDTVAIRTARASELESVSAELSGLIALIQAHVDGAKIVSARLRLAVAALVYLRDPYDAHYDQHRHFGLQDDCQRIRRAARAVRI